MNICGVQKVKCYLNADRNLFGEDVTEGLVNEDAKTYRHQCNCLPACNAINYAIDVDRSFFDRRNWIKRATLDQSAEYKTSIINFFMKQINIGFNLI